MNNILENIRSIATNEGITITKLEHKIGASKGVLSRAISKKTDIQSKWIIKIVENYPQYSCDWLIKNKGAMIKQNLQSDSFILEHEINYKELAESRKETIESMKKEILHLEQKITAAKQGNQ
jgi:hypothetical protein